MSTETPLLTGAAAGAVSHRGSHLQIIAAAGSGKTEVVSQRVASLLGEGAPPQSIVAFTFTERAAAELRDRIERRAADIVGSVDHPTLESSGRSVRRQGAPVEADGREGARGGRAARLRGH